jgi:hypothetical protein
VNDQTAVQELPETTVAHDGLRDEQGPIPVFGPVLLDEHGRIVMSDEEGRARSAAGLRAIKALAKLPDADPPGIDELIMREIDEGRPHRPLFTGIY